jgi:hypothetical protein
MRLCHEGLMTLRTEHFVWKYGNKRQDFKCCRSFQVRFRSFGTIDENSVLVHYFPLLVGGKILCRAKVNRYLNFCFTKERVSKLCRLYHPSSLLFYNGC